MIEPTPAPLVFHNVKDKIYPDGTIKRTICSEPIFKDDAWELCNRDPQKKNTSKSKKISDEVRPDNVRRAKCKVFDISLCNEFDYFITWTLDEKEVNRYDPVIVSQRLKRFLSNMVQRNNLRYLIIPEHHKDGAIHLHGLISGDIELLDSGKRTKDGKIIFNMPQWKLGFSTVIPITGDRANVSKYITKYISKDFRKIFGSFYYAGGKGLKRSPVIRLSDVDFYSIDEKSFVKVSLAFKYKIFKE